MSTHNVEVRLKVTTVAEEGIGTDRQWFPINRTPMNKQDAEKLLQHLGDRYWEGRIVAVGSPMGQEFAEFERLLDDRGADIHRWEKIELAHHPLCTFGRRTIPAPTREAWTVRELGTRENDVMTGDEWNQLRHLQECAGDMDGSYPFTVRIHESPLVHHGRCSECGAEKRALSIKVTITSELECTTREYSL